MPAQWTGDLIGKMHVHNISHLQLAEKAGLNPKYLSTVLNGHRNPPNAKERLYKALDDLIAQNTTEKVP